MKRNRIFRHILLLGFILGLQAISAGENSPGKHPGKFSGKHPQVEKLFSLGKAEDIPENENELFGLILALKTDSENHLYVLDKQPLSILKYDSEGQFLQKIILKKGNGPGEFVGPVDFAIDQEKRFYIADRELRRLTVFDKTGAYLKSWQLNLMPARVAFGNDKILVNGFEFSYEGALIQVYSRKGAFLYAFGKRADDWRTTSRTGSCGSLGISAASKVYWGHAYPYQIHQCDISGKKQWQAVRKIKGVDTPVIKDGMAVSRGRIRHLGCLSKERIGVVVELENAKWQLDIFDGDGNFRITIPFEKFGLHNDFYFRFMAIDREDCIYLDTLEPYPHINKYRITDL